MNRMAPLILLAAISYSVLAEEEGEKAKYVDDFQLKPVIIDAEKSEASSVALDFNLNGKLVEVELDSEEGEEIDFETVIGGYDLTYYIKGLIAEDSENNPKDFIETSLSGHYFRSAAFSLKIGAFIKSESDQRFDDKQTVYGFTTAFANRDNFASNDQVAAQLNIGQVDPSEDKDREAMLGNKLAKYERADLELLYTYNIGENNLDTFEVNLRYFYELDPNRAISDADMDRFKLITYRLGFMRNLFVAYSSGELPFNERDNQIYELGFSYKFE